MSPRRLAALLVLLVLAVTGCESSAGSGGEAVPDLLDTGTTSDIDYVALGDSFSAGPFIGTMRTDPEGCARSRDNYPAFLADWLDVASYTDVTCSAATTADLYGTMTMINGEPTGPQIDAISADTDLVTLGMGGNDFGIYDSLIHCQDGSGLDCPVADLRADARKVAGRIEQAVRRITKVAPDAAVYVVGYPDILPAERTCAAVGVSADVLAPVAEVASEGHDVCARGRAWINGPRFRAGIAAPFHPKINGMRATAAEVYASITGEEPDVTEYAEPDPDVVVLNEG